MNVRNLLTANALIEIGFGLLVLSVPAWLASMAGAALTEPEGVLYARMFGGAIISIGSLSWWARGRRSPDLLTLIVNGMLLFHALLSGVLILGQITGARTAWGWSVVALHVLLLAAFAYLKRTGTR